MGASSQTDRTPPLGPAWLSTLAAMRRDPSPSAESIPPWRWESARASRSAFSRAGRSASVTTGADAKDLLGVSDYASAARGTLARAGVTPRDRPARAVPQRCRNLPRPALHRGRARHSSALDARLSVSGITSITCSIVLSAISPHFLYGSPFA